MFDSVFAARSPSQAPASLVGGMGIGHETVKSELEAGLFLGNRSVVVGETTSKLCKQLHRGIHLYERNVQAYRHSVSQHMISTNRSGRVCSLR